MSIGMQNNNFGDSARNKSSSLNFNASEHVFDEAGENIKCHSDSESVASKKSKSRYINPAIFIEKIESTHSVTSLHTDSCNIEDITPHPHSTYRSNSTPFLTGRVSNGSSSSVKRKSCRLTEANLDDYGDGLEETPRNERYQEDGSDTFRLSVASISTTTTAKQERERQEQKKQEAFKQWLARKEQEKREKARLERLKSRNVQTKSAEQQREDTFQHWLENKRNQAERRRAEEIMRQYRQKEQLDLEKKKRQSNRDEKLADWIRKKEEEIKAMKTRKERRIALAAMEEERRRMISAQAYQDWLRSSKNKPLPVPLNQGELSMRGSVSQMYINPIPWQSPT